MKIITSIVLFLGITLSIQEVISEQTYTFFQMTDVSIMGLDGSIMTNAVYNAMIFAYTTDCIHYGDMPEAIFHEEFKFKSRKYSFKKEEYSIRDLAILEANLGSSISKEDHSELQKCLNYAKSDLINFITKNEAGLYFLKRMESWNLIKNYTANWCCLRHRERSLLLAIVGLPKSTIKIIQDIKNLQAFDAFLTDLSDILFDFIYSCPGACCLLRNSQPKMVIAFSEVYLEKAAEIFHDVDERRIINKNKHQSR